MRLMHSYRICDLALASNIPLPELVPATDFGVECRFELLTAREPSPAKVAWINQWPVEQDDDQSENEEPWVCFGRRDDGYLLRFPSCGDFFLSDNAQEIRCYPLPDIPEVTVRHLLLDQVIPLVLSRRERIVLHASAVSTTQGVIAFAGKSGRGKSTLAASFARKGCALVSDDCLVLRKAQGIWTALPSYPGVRLWPSAAGELLHDDANTTDVAHYTSKLRASDMDGMPFSSCPAPLRGLYLLADEHPAITVERLASARAFMAWVEFAYNLDITDSAFLRRQFETVGQLTADVRSYALHYPRDFASLPAVIEAILNHLEAVEHDPE